MADKITTYWRVRSGDDPDAKPHWGRLDAQPKTTEGLVGELRVENDDQVMLVSPTRQHAFRSRGTREMPPRSCRWWPQARVRIPLRLLTRCRRVAIVTSV